MARFNDGVALSVCRDYWHAMETYHKLSPFTYALELAERGSPLLLIHGDNDNNAGTHPMQSERMYQAVSGQGGVVKLVILPHESHGYKARESIMHTLAEQVRGAVSISTAALHTCVVLST